MRISGLIRQRRTRVNSPPLAAFHCLYRYPAALRRGSSFVYIEQDCEVSVEFCEYEQLKSLNT